MIHKLYCVILGYDQMDSRRYGNLQEATCIQEESQDMKEVPFEPLRDVKGIGGPPPRKRVVPFR